MTSPAAAGPPIRFGGLVAGAHRVVKCRPDTEGIVVAVSGIATFAFNAERGSITIVERSPGVSDALIADALLGPPLILSLALGGVFCLHAGAVVTDHGVVVFLGRSGNGKSTLAAAAERHFSDWRRCADDMLPFAEREGRITALPAFPQPKLAAELQWPATAAEEMPLRAICIIADADPRRVDISIDSLGRREALHGLLRHSVAWPLFWNEAADEHLALCEKTAATVPIRRLAYARDFEKLPQLLEALANNLEEPPGETPGVVDPLSHENGGAADLSK